MYVFATPILFCIYMDSLLNELIKSNVGYHIGGMFAVGFGYADDLKLLTPSVHALRILANICEYAAKYNVTFNGKKSQLIIYYTNLSGHDPQTLVFLSIMSKFPG